MPAAVQSRLRGARQNLAGRPMLYTDWLGVAQVPGTSQTYDQVWQGVRGGGQPDARFVPQYTQAMNQYYDQGQAMNRLGPAVPQYAGGAGPSPRAMQIQRAAEDRQRRAAEKQAALAHQREMEQLRMTTGTQYDIASGNAAADLYRQEMVGNQQFNQLREQGAINQVLSREEQAARMRLQELAGRQDMAAVQERGQIEQAIQEMRGRQAMAERASMNENALQLDDRATQRAITLDERGEQRAYNLQDMGSAAAMGLQGLRGEQERGLQQMTEQGLNDRLRVSGQQNTDLQGLRGQQNRDLQGDVDRGAMDRLDRGGQLAAQQAGVAHGYGMERDAGQAAARLQEQKAVGQSYQDVQGLRGEQEKEQAHQLEMYKREQQGFTRDPRAQQELDKIESEISTVVRFYKENRIDPEYYQSEMARLQESRRAVEMPNKRPTRHKTEDQIEERKGGGFFIKDPTTGEVNQYIPPDRRPAGSTGPDWMTQRKLQQQDKRAEAGQKYLIDNVQAYRARIGQIDSTTGVPFQPTAEEQKAYIDALKADVQDFINPPPPPQAPPQPYGNEMMDQLMPQQSGQLGPQSGYERNQRSNLSEMLPSQLMQGFQPPPAAGPQRGPDEAYETPFVTRTPAQVQQLAKELTETANNLAEDEVLTSAIERYPHLAPQIQASAVELQGLLREQVVSLRAGRNFAADEPGKVRRMNELVQSIGNPEAHIEAGGYSTAPVVSPVQAALDAARNPFPTMVGRGKPIASTRKDNPQGITDRVNNFLYDTHQSLAGAITGETPDARKKRLKAEKAAAAEEQKLQEEYRKRHDELRTLYNRYK